MTYSVILVLGIQHDSVFVCIVKWSPQWVYLISITIYNYRIFFPCDNLFLKKYIFYWSIIDLQCFKYTARRFSYTNTHIVFEIIVHHRLSQDIDCSSLCYTVNLCCLLHICFLIRNLAFYSTELNKWNQNVIVFLVRQKFISFPKYIYYTYLYIYIHKSFFTTLDSMRKNIKKKKRRDGEIGKHKLNEMGALNMK